MYRNRSPSEILQFWQDEVEHSVEADSTPVLEFGVSGLPTDDTPSLLALQHWSVQRTDVSTPLIPAGGLGPLWLAAMMGPVPHYDQTHPPAPAVLFTGANEAEYLATVTLLHAAVDPPSLTAQRRAAVPMSYFAPHSQPGLSVSWDLLPFLEMYDRPMAARVDETDNTELPAQEAYSDPIRDWLAWAALLLALFLVMLAVVL